MGTAASAGMGPAWAAAEEVAAVAVVAAAAAEEEAAGTWAGTPAGT
ncbi:hypothetical protein IMF23_14120 [Chelatococcus daeguensis]|nr:hypothetical protein [Chelatococcus daeguensis]MBM3084575.1 hypothetical protein [Chelatococcus daeguensis]